MPVNERALYVSDRFARKQEAKKKTQVELLMDSPLWGQRTPRPRTFQEFRSMKRSSHVAPNKGSGCGC